MSPLGTIEGERDITQTPKNKQNTRPPPIKCTEITAKVEFRSPTETEAFHFLFLFCSSAVYEGLRMPDIEFIRSEIERMRYQVQRQRGEIRQLQRAGIPCASAEALLDR